MRNHVVLIVIMYTNNWIILLKIATIVFSITDFTSFIVYVYQIKYLKLPHYIENGKLPHYVEIEIKILHVKLKICH